MQPPQPDTGSTTRSRWTRKVAIGLALVVLAYAIAVVWLLRSEAVLVLSRTIQDEAPVAERMTDPTVRWWLPWKIWERGDNGMASFVVCGKREGEYLCYRAKMEKVNGRWIVQSLLPHL